MATRNVEPKEKARTALVVPLVDAQKAIGAQINNGKELSARKIHTVEELSECRASYDTWHDYTKELLRRIFSTDELAEEFANVLGFAYSYIRTPTIEERITAFQSKLRRDLERLKSICERLPLIPSTAVNSQTDPKMPINAIERIARRFHLITRQLRERHENRTTLDIVDEYDVQYLLHALLRLFFDDIRPEEWTPSYAGGSSRMDFLLKAEKTVVEVKKTRRGIGAKEIGNQLLEDIGRYRAHPDCRALVCFVYDPEGLIANPDGLERDLSQPVNDMALSVIIGPKGRLVSQ